MNSSVKLSGSLADKSKIRIERKHMKKKAGVTRPIQMSREEKIDLMIDKDIKSIRESILAGDYTFLTAVLSGEGFTPYNKLSDQEIEEEYGEMNRKENK